MAVLIIGIALVIAGALGLAKVLTLVVLSVIALVAGIILVFAHLGWLGSRV
ncbi:MAG TPA: hypothetical protein VIT65_20515 [Microlunatus sp.]